MPRMSTPCNARVCVTKRMPTRIALTKRSAGSELLRRSRHHPYSTTRMPMHERAFSANTSHAPTAATRTPAIAGPMARETLMAMLFSATAGCSSSLGTSSGMTAAQAGIASAVPAATAKVKPKSAQGVVSSSHVNIASAEMTKRK